MPILKPSKETLPIPKMLQTQIVQFTNQEKASEKMAEAKNFQNMPLLNKLQHQHCPNTDMKCLIYKSNLYNLNRKKRWLKTYAIVRIEFSTNGNTKWPQ